MTDKLEQESDSNGITKSITLKEKDGFYSSFVEKIDPTQRECQLLIVSLTRQLTKLIEEIIAPLANKRKLSHYVCVGKTDVNDDFRRLKKGVQVVIGTPGRVLDMMKRRALFTNLIDVFVLEDSGQNMSNKSFEKLIKDVYLKLRAGVQTFVLSSCTLSYMSNFSYNFFRTKPVQITVKLTPEENEQLKFNNLSNSKKLQYERRLKEQKRRIEAEENSHILDSKRSKVDLIEPNSTKNSEDVTNSVCSDSAKNPEEITNSTHSNQAGEVTIFNTFKEYEEFRRSNEYNWSKLNGKAE